MAGTWGDSSGSWRSIRDTSSACHPVSPLYSSYCWVITKKKKGYMMGRKGVHTVHTNGMLFQLVTTKMANKIRLVRPGPVTKFKTTFFQSTCASESPPATAAEPTPTGSKKPSAFAEAIAPSNLTVPCPRGSAEAVATAAVVVVMVQKAAH